MEFTGLSPFLHELIDPWHASLEKPAEAQWKTLEGLLQEYAKTRYGKEFGADRIGSIKEFQAAFPLTSYARLTLYLDAVKNGDYSALIPEPVPHWVMTRGTTGKSKLIPTTQTHLSQILTVGARAIVNFALRTHDVSVLEKSVLNLNFPSQVGVLRSSSGDEPFSVFSFFSCLSYLRSHLGGGVTCGDTPATTEVPQLGQKVAFSGSAAPHFTQNLFPDDNLPARYGGDAKQHIKQYAVSQA